MKRALFCSLLVFLMTSCKTAVPLSPKPHPEKYALQIVCVSVPDKTEEKEMRLLTPQEIELLLHRSDAEIFEFPVPYAAVGETTQADDSIKMLLPETFEVISENGKSKIQYKKEPERIGSWVEFTVLGVEADRIEIQFNAESREIQGVQTYTVKPADTEGVALTAEMPVFSKRSLQTRVVDLFPGIWSSMGELSLSTQRKSYAIGAEESSKSECRRESYLVRVIAPK